MLKKRDSEIIQLKTELEAFKQNEKMFHALVETAVGDIGEDFFNKIVEKLAEWLNAECVIIGQLISENTVEGFPLYLDGKIIHGFTYQLKDTPCDLTSKKGYCVFDDNVGDIYPKSKDIAELNIKGYVGTALYNKEGKPNGILCAMSRKKLQLPPQAEDILRIVGVRITAEIERSRTQNALQLSEENLLKANESKDKLFSIISHDLKQPFNALLGYCGLILHASHNQDMTNIKKYASVINDVSQQTYDLLINLLDWSMTQTNEIKFFKESIFIDDIFSEIIDLQRNIAQQKTITLKSNTEKQLKVIADKNMLVIILRNLVSNAIKFTQKDGHVMIQAIKNNNEIMFSVTDDGIGIEPLNLEKLFNFENYSSTKGTENEKGAGLGLMLCKELVKKHNGKIWVESEPGKGSKFFFTVSSLNQ